MEYRKVIFERRLRLAMEIYSWVLGDGEPTYDALDYLQTEEINVLKKQHKTHHYRRFTGTSAEFEIAVVDAALILYTELLREEVRK